MSNIIVIHIIKFYIFPCSLSLIINNENTVVNTCHKLIRELRNDKQTLTLDVKPTNGYFSCCNVHYLR